MMKNMTRLIACVLVLATLIACLPLTAMAGTYSGTHYKATASSTRSGRTWYISHIVLRVDKLSRDGMTAGTLTNYVSDRNYWGIYDIKVTRPNGKVVNYTWNAQNSKEITVIKATWATGTYKVEVQPVEMSTSLARQYVWEKYPTYKVVYNWYK